ncbi:MAG: ACT domain-containing protein [Bryobacterales bacterium]|nr:ACT domain-containing protein [Bryobacterales bacterium]
MLFFVRLSLLAARFAIVQSPAPVAAAGSFFSCTVTGSESSYVMEEALVPEGIEAENLGWRVLMVEGPLDFALTGVLASLAAPLAEAGVSIFAVSTYDTDYVLVKEETLPRAVAALQGAGHEVAMA